MIQGRDYLKPIINELLAAWPNNRTVNIVCHGHSVPSGYFTTPYVNTMNAYPHLLHKILNERFPFAVTNVIVTAKGGENAVNGEKRFENDVLIHRPDVIVLDYSLNDRSSGLKGAKDAWSLMIEKALKNDVKVILCTPSWDISYYEQGAAWDELCAHAEQVRELASRYDVGLADSFKAFEKQIKDFNDLPKYLANINHPTKAGHELIAEEIAKYFIICE